MDNTPEGQLIIQVVSKLIRTVEEFLMKIGRYDYVDGYYEWEVHLTANNQVNACCYPGGKIIVYAGLFSIANTEERLAFVLAHELAHALLDHGRTKASAQNTQNGLASAVFLGSFALDLIGLGGAGSMARAATNIVSMGSQFFLMQPWGRDQEYEADKLGMVITHLAGYDIREVPKFWREHVGDNAGTFDFFSTHPADEKRIAVMLQSEEEILNTIDFYSRPVLPETPKPIGENTSPALDTSVNASQMPQAASQSAFAGSQNQNMNKDTSRRCPNCGSSLGLNDKFCMNCGSKVEIIADNKSRCPLCGEIIQDGDSFCTNCGTKVAVELKCPACGSQVDKGDAFCFNCGNKLN